jgi:hypothetical protein
MRGFSEVEGAEGAQRIEPSTGSGLGDPQDADRWRLFGAIAVPIPARCPGSAGRGVLNLDLDELP